MRDTDGAQLNTKALRSLKVTFSELRQVVATNDKQRFSMIPVSALEDSPEPDPNALPAISESEYASDYLIRANQGHSIKVDAEHLLTPITLDAANVPETVVHGTDEPAWRLILKSGGLRRMGRNHIHFATGLPAGFLSQDAAAAAEAPPVISGMRKSSTVLIYLDIQAALDAGIKFFLSENGVVLTEGNEDGFVPYQFFKRVESRKKGGGVLMSGGELPEGVVVDVAGWEAEVGLEGGKGKRGGRGGRRGRGGGRGGKARVNEDSGDMMAGV